MGARDRAHPELAEAASVHSSDYLCCFPTVVDLIVRFVRPQRDTYAVEHGIRAVWVGGGHTWRTASSSLQGEKRRSMPPISGPDTPNRSSEEPESFWPTVLLAAKTYGKGVLNPLFSSVFARVRAENPIFSKTCRRCMA